MIKKEYMQPAIQVCQADTEMQILAYSIKTTGLDDDKLDFTDESGNMEDACVKGNGWDDDWSE